MIKKVTEYFNEVGLKAWSDILDVRYYLASRLAEKQYDSILDIGSGKGVMLKVANAKLKVGIDPNLEFLIKCKKTWPELEFIQAVGEKLPFKEKTFSLVMSIGIPVMFEKERIDESCLELDRVAVDELLIMMPSKKMSHKEITSKIESKFEIKAEGWNPLPEMKMFMLRKMLSNEKFEEKVFSQLRIEKLEDKGLFYFLDCKRI